MFSSIIFFSSLLFTAATAAPLEARSTCNPDFEGAILTVSSYTGKPYGRLSWSSNPAVGAPVVASTAASRWYVQQNGDYNPATYTFKNIDNLLFDVELKDEGLIMDNIDWSGANVNQKWKVECGSCATDIAHQLGIVASGCTISPAAPSASGKCVTQNGFGQQLDLVACPAGGLGNFYFSV
ncbi:uncharacterized protein EV420DRAFT_1649147 [Desarmillaria tabescens]|uniref:Ricin B lectin domain-containing protein n=1 Tax=Armillaria tabescens TaxID=1929756 RepID=A0AA39MQU3_ARMTA|nr:uncharacterized protein EV420DRAFT_1649147 [Desarmillaria tabescens]KAK0443686.1 hypothetical protein EV420DRAFT_1649147 [Desarmillaria tabescens]